MVIRNRFDHREEVQARSLIGDVTQYHVYTILRNANLEVRKVMVAEMKVVR
jgi:hypothetical protein